MPIYVARTSEPTVEYKDAGTFNHGYAMWPKALQAAHLGGGVSNQPCTPATSRRTVKWDNGYLSSRPQYPPRNWASAMPTTSCQDGWNPTLAHPGTRIKECNEQTFSRRYGYGNRQATPRLLRYRMPKLEYGTEPRNCSSTQQQRCKVQVQRWAVPLPITER